MQKKLTATLTEGSVAGHLKSMALPMVWGLLATMLMNAIEAFYIARLGRVELSAFSFTFPIVMVLTSLGIGIGAGTSSAVARAIGEGDSQQARRLATDAMSLTLLLSLAVSLIGSLTIEPLFLSLGATKELIPLIHSYMVIWYWSAPCLLVPMVTLAALRAMGMSRVQGYLMSGAALFNIALAPALIFGVPFFSQSKIVPALGLEGAALATLITRICMLVVAVYILQSRMQMLVNPFVSVAQIKSSWKKITEVAAPAMVANVIIPIASALVVKMVSSYGTDAVAGLGVATRIEPLALIIFYALSGVIGPFFGQNTGANQFARLSEALNVLVRFSFAFGFLVAVILWLFGDFFAQLFHVHDEVVRITALYLAIVPMSYGTYGIVMSVNAAFNGLGKPWPAMLISAARVVWVFLPLAYLGKFLWGIEGIFMATATTNICVGLWAWWWLNKHIKKISAS